MEVNSIDFIVCDPPYMIGFMGKEFDKFENNPAASIELWKETLRICKPGSMLAAFGGDRTHHHLMMALENAGWEIRTCIYWATGQGFPKSHNFGKQLSAEWEGYGTALKPAVEIIVLCMKPLDGTFAQNAQKWGVAGINIDECRIGSGGTKRSHQAEYPRNPNGKEDRSQHWARTGHSVESNGLGRWPANLILDQQAAEALDQQSGVLKSGELKPHKNKKMYQGWGFKEERNYESNSNSGGASRFFYCAKSSTSERNKGCETNGHPTVKPLSLMRYIIKLLAPPGDPILLDPFAGSGSTLCAAAQLGIRAIGIEKEEEYCDIVRKRVEYWQKQPRQLELDF